MGHLRGVTTSTGAVPLVWDAVGGVPQVRQLGGAQVVGAGEPLALVAPGGAATPVRPDVRGDVGGARDSWGAPAHPGADPRFGYRGELEFAGLTWLRHRVYDPVTAGFLSPDPLPPLLGSAAVNPYSYAGDDPVGCIDPMGLQPMTDAGAQQMAEAEDKPWYEDAWDWVVDNGDALAAGALAVGAVALVATGVGAPIGAGILIGMGVSGGLQLATTGEVDARQLWVSGLAGGFSGGVGAGVAGVGGGLLAQTAAGVGTGAVSSVASQAVLNDGRIDPGQVLVDSALGGVGGAAGPAIARLRGGLPDPSQVDLVPPQARTHILDGDGPGRGGHRWPGQPGKTPFPLTWSDNRIMHNVSDVATDPASTTTWLAGKVGSLYTNAGNPSHINQFGTRDGVPLLVGSHPMGDGINTAFPDVGRPSPEWRRFQELYQDVSPGGFNAFAPEGASSYDGQQN